MCASVSALSGLAIVHRVATKRGQKPPCEGGWAPAYLSALAILGLVHYAYGGTDHLVEHSVATMLATSHTATFDAELTGKGIRHHHTGTWYWQDPTHFRMETKRTYREEWKDRILEGEGERLLIRSPAGRYLEYLRKGRKSSMRFCRHPEMIETLHLMEYAISDRQPALLWLRQNWALYDYEPVPSEGQDDDTVVLSGKLNRDTLLPVAEARHGKVKKHFPGIAKMIPTLARVLKCSIPEALAFNYPERVTVTIDRKTSFVTALELEAGPGARGFAGGVFKRIVWRQTSLTLDVQHPANRFQYRLPKNIAIIEDHPPAAPNKAR